MINFEKQFDNIESKFIDIESNLNNQTGLDTEKLIKLNKEYAELSPIVETIKKYKGEKEEIDELSKLINDNDPSIKELAEVELKEKTLIVSCDETVSATRLNESLIEEGIIVSHLTEHKASLEEEFLNLVS